VSLAVVVLICYAAVRAVHRVYFSPISKFLDPKFAALTLWYCNFLEILHETTADGKGMNAITMRCFVVSIHSTYAICMPGTGLLFASICMSHMFSTRVIDKLYALSVSGEKLYK